MNNIKDFSEMTPTEKTAWLIYTGQPDTPGQTAGEKKVFFTARDVGLPTMILTTGQMTPYFNNLRDLTCINVGANNSFHILVELMASKISAKIDGQKYDAIITAAEAGETWGGALAYTLHKSAPYMTSKVKKGLDQTDMTMISPITGETLQLLHIYGHVAGKKAIFLEDTVSSFKTGEVLYFSAKKAGLEVLPDTFCYFDRLQTPSGLKEKLGLKINSLIDILKFTDLGLTWGKLSKEDYNHIRLYQKNEQSYCLDTIENNKEWFKHNEMAPKVIDYYNNNGMPNVSELLKRII